MKAKTKKILFGVAVSLIIAGVIVALVYDVTPETPEVVEVEQIDSVDMTAPVDTVAVDTTVVE